MKALTVRQPWASLIVTGYKDVENRTWPTLHRGPLAIHAGVGVAPVAHWEQVDLMVRLGHCPPMTAELQANLATGMVIGTVEVVDCVQGYESPWANDGAWHWMLDNAHLFQFPFAYKGAQGLWTLPDDVADPTFSSAAPGI